MLELKGEFKLFENVFILLTQFLIIQLITLLPVIIQNFILTICQDFLVH